MVSVCFLGSRQAAIVSRIDCDVGGVGGPLEARKLRSPAFSLGLGAIRLARLPASAWVAPVLALDARPDPRARRREPVVGMKPLACPGCQGRRTTFQIIAPSKGGACGGQKRRPSEKPVRLC